MRDAESNAEEDKKKRREVEIRNEADMILYQTEKTLSENREKLADADISEVEKAISEAKDAIKANDTPGIERSIDTLKAASHVIAEKLYSKTSQTAQGDYTESTGDAQTSGDDDVIDAEFTDSV